MAAETEREKNNEVPRLFSSLSWRRPENSKMTYTPNIIIILI
jgi:hypothetical protein